MVQKSHCCLSFMICFLHLLLSSSLLLHANKNRLQCLLVAVYLVKAYLNAVLSVDRICSYVCLAILSKVVFHSW